MTTINRESHIVCNFNTFKAMKTFLIFLCLLLSTGVYSQEFKQLDDAKINHQQLQFVKKFVADYFAEQAAGGYYAFSDNTATDAMSNALSASKQKTVYDQLTSAFGAFKSFSYVQTWVDNNSHLTIYRFKGTFGTNNFLEIRVVMNYQGKIAGFFIKPWSETL